MATRKTASKSPAARTVKPAATAAAKPAAAPSRTAKTPTARSAAAAAKPAKVPVAAAKEAPAPSGEARYRWIAHAAYLRAERRGFAPGQEIDDWLAAEAEFLAAYGAR